MKNSVAKIYQTTDGKTEFFSFDTVLNLKHLFFEKIPQNVSDF